jgi:hypothetical protein
MGGLRSTRIFPETAVELAPYLFGLGGRTGSNAKIGAERVVGGIAVIGIVASLGFIALTMIG